MKKIIAVLMCVAQTTCFAMNNEPKDLVTLEMCKDNLDMLHAALHIQSNKEQKKQTDALKDHNKLLQEQNELLRPIAIDACRNLEAHSKEKIPEYNILFCMSLRQNFSELIKNNQNNS